MRRLAAGFTLIETLLVMGIVLVLFGFSTISLTNLIPKASLNTTIQTITTDLSQQQTKAMLGESEGSESSQAYGIYFGTNEYVLFRGSTYSSSQPANMLISLADNLQIITTFSNSVVIFSERSGEVAGFVEGFNTITLSNTQNGQQQVITLNKLGVITGL